jgi:hypothetical protein
MAKAVPNKAKVSAGNPTNGMAKPKITDPTSPTIITMSAAP